MKIKLNKNSWHYQIASKDFFIFTDYYYYVNNLCQYIRDFLLGCLLLISLIFMGVVLGYCMFVDPILFLITVFKYGPVDINPPGVMGLSILFICMISFLFFQIIEKLENSPWEKKNTERDSFLYNAYKNFKEKTCVKIDWDEK